MPIGFCTPGLYHATGRRRAKSEEQRAKRKEQRAKSKRTKRKELRALRPSPFALCPFYSLPFALCADILPFSVHSPQLQLIPAARRCSGNASAHLNRKHGAIDELS